MKNIKLLLFLFVFFALYGVITASAAPFSDFYDNFDGYDGQLPNGWYLNNNDYISHLSASPVGGIAVTNESEQVPKRLVKQFEEEANFEEGSAYLFGFDFHLSTGGWYTKIYFALNKEENVDMEYYRWTGDNKESQGRFVSTGAFVAYTGQAISPKANAWHTVNIVFDLTNSKGDGNAYAYYFVDGVRLTKDGMDACNLGPISEFAAKVHNYLIIGVTPGKFVNTEGSDVVSVNNVFGRKLVNNELYTDMDYYQPLGTKKYTVKFKNPVITSNIESKIIVKRDGIILNDINIVPINSNADITYGVDIVFSEDGMQIGTYTIEVDETLMDVVGNTFGHGTNVLSYIVEQIEQAVYYFDGFDELSKWKVSSSGMSAELVDVDAAHGKSLKLISENVTNSIEIILNQPLDFQKPGLYSISYDLYLDGSLPEKTVSPGQLVYVNLLGMGLTGKNIGFAWYSNTNGLSGYTVNNTLEPRNIQALVPGRWYNFKTVIDTTKIPAVILNYIDGRFIYEVEHPSVNPAQVITGIRFSARTSSNVEDAIIIDNLSVTEAGNSSILLGKNKNVMVLEEGQQDIVLNFISPIHANVSEMTGEAVKIIMYEKDDHLMLNGIPYDKYKIGTVTTSCISIKLDSNDVVNGRRFEIMLDDRLKNAEGIQYEPVYLYIGNTSQPAMVAVQYMDYEENVIKPANGVFPVAVSKLKVYATERAREIQASISGIDTNSYALGNYIIIDLAEPLSPKSSYSLWIKSSNMQNEISSMFITGEGGIVIKNIAFVDGLNQVVYEAKKGDVLRVMAEIVNLTGTEATVYLSYSAFDNNEMIDLSLDTKGITLTWGKGFYYTDYIEVPDTIGYGEMKGFIINNYSELKPLKDCATLTISN